MHISLTTLALAAGFIASSYTAYAISENEIPADIPVSSLLSSAQSQATLAVKVRFPPRRVILVAAVYMNPAKVQWTG